MKAPPSPARLWTFRLVSATLLPVALLLVLEGLLRLFGVGSPTGFTLPCEVQGLPAFCENPEFSAPFFPPGMARRPTPFVIPAEKRAGTFRIFVLGESAALGDPEPTFGFSRFLEAMLRERFPERTFEVINAGVVAINSHALLPIARDLAQRQGDLFIVYAGNNEVVGPFGSGTVFTRAGPGLGAIRASLFLRSTRLGQLFASLGRTEAKWGGMEMFLGHQVREGDPSLAAVYRNFEANLRELIEALRGSGARVVVSTVGTRLRDFAPFASAHREGLSSGDLASWEAHLKSGARQEAANHFAEARAEYQAAAALDEDFAELQYRLGRSALALGDAAAARAHLVRARDLDTLRFRADSTLDRIIRSTAQAAGAQLIDGAAAFDEGGIPGAEVFYEHAHPTPHGNYLLARALFPAVAAAGPDPSVATVSRAPSEDTCQRRLALTGFDRYRIAKEVLRRLSRPPFSAQLDHGQQVSALELERDRAAAEEFGVSEAAYRAALELSGADPWLRENYAILLDTRDVFLARRGQQDAGRATAQYQKVLEQLPQFAEARYRLAEALLRTGHPDQAIGQARELLRRRPRYALAWQAIAQALSMQGRAGEAQKAQERALALDPALSRPIP